MDLCYECHWLVPIQDCALELRRQTKAWVLPSPILPATVLERACPYGTMVLCAPYGTAFVAHIQRLGFNSM